MKALLALTLLALATSCSSSATKTDKAADTAKAAKAETKAEAKAADAHAAKAEKAAKKAEKAAKSEASEKANCKSGSDSRLIEVVSKGAGCAVHYTKHNEMQEIASAEHETQHCSAVAQKVRGKLEAAGYSCN